MDMDPDNLKKKDWVGSGGSAFVYRVSPTVVVKIVRHRDDYKTEHPFLKEIRFFESIKSRTDRCPDIIECPDQFPVRLLHVKEYEDPGLVARWIRQLTPALEYVESMGCAHNDVHPRNCLLDNSFNLKLADFDCTTKIGQFVETAYTPWARMIPDGPLAGTYGLCGARSEQFAVGSVLYYMVYGQEPYEDLDLKDKDPQELDPCWYNVYPTMAMLAYDFKRKTGDVVSHAAAEHVSIQSVKERKACEALIQGGLLGPDLALTFQPMWRRGLHATIEKGLFGWSSPFSPMFIPISTS
ncbi:kinase-like domain-containing protein [Aspergillus californicus]